MIIECSKCGAVNRIPDLAEPSENLFCDECKTELNHLPKTSFTQRVKSAFLQAKPSERHVFVPLVLMFLVGILSTLYHRLPFTFTYDDISSFYETAIE